jgi:hypothetical protein
MHRRRLLKIFRGLAGWQINAGEGHERIPFCCEKSMVAAGESYLLADTLNTKSLISIRQELRARCFLLILKGLSIIGIVQPGAGVH